MRRARAFRRPRPDPVSASRIFQREKRLSGRAARSQKRSSKRGLGDGRLRCRRGAPPRGRGGRHGGAGTEGSSSYRIGAERARLRVLHRTRTRASAEPITVSRAAASARASSVVTTGGLPSPLGVPWRLRRFFPLPGRSLPFPLGVVRDPQTRLRTRLVQKSKTVDGELERPPRASPSCLRSLATAFWGSTTRWSTYAAAPGRGTRRGSVGRIFGDRHGHPRHRGALVAADGPPRGGGTAQHQREGHS